MTAAVVDASVLVAALLDSGPAGTRALAEIEGLELAAPHLVLAEAANIIRRAALARIVDEVDAALAYRDLRRLDIELFEFEPFAGRIWALRRNVTAYDASYVALAEALGCELLTLDRRLARAPGIACPVRVP